MGFFDVSLMAIRIPVPWPIIVGLVAMVLVFAPARYLEWEDNAQSGCAGFALLVGIAVIWLLHEAGHQVW